MRLNLGLFIMFFKFHYIMHQEKYSLKWHTYSDHLKNMMKELMMNEDFSDVTLVTEDKKQIKANINILSACSPVFKDIFKKEKMTGTVMYLRGIKFSEMESIMQYVYLGEATFYEERMDEFLSVAKSLEIKDLCNTENETNFEPKEEPQQTDPVIPTDKMEEKAVKTESTNTGNKQLQLKVKTLEIKDLCNTEIETNFEAKEKPQQTDPVIQEQSVTTESTNNQVYNHYMIDITQ